MAKLDFPNIDRTTVSESEDEEEYLMVDMLDVCEGFELHGSEEVREGLGKALSCILEVPWFIK